MGHLAHSDRLQEKVTKKEYEERFAKETYDRIAQLQPINEKGIITFVKPLGTFSGDFICSTKTPSDFRYILFADFSGHGLSAALGAIPITSVFNGMAEKGSPLDEIIREVNKKACQQLPTGQFCCACFISLSLDRSQITVWNVGLPDLLVVKRESQEIQHISSNDVALGIEKNAYQSVQFNTLNFQPGDFLLVYTDGFIEAENIDKQAFGPKLENIVLNQRNNQNLMSMLETELDNHLQDTEQKDDISMLEIRC